MTMIFDELEEQYLEALWAKIEAEIDEEEDGQPEEQLEYLELKYQIRYNKLLLDELKQIRKALCCKKSL